MGHIAAGCGDERPAVADDRAHRQCRGIWKTLYGHSLAIVFFLLFFLSFSLHALGSWRAKSQENRLDGLLPPSFTDPLFSSDFWFESMQNWQSEFLAVLALVVLTIFLRQKDSPQSKAVEAPHSQTGAELNTPALLIIDLFSKFDFPDGQQLAPLALQAAKKASRIRAVFDERDWPVIYANDNFGDCKCGFHQLAEVCRHEHGPPGDIARLIFPSPDHYTVLKPKHSAFLATPLAVLLAKLDVRTLVLVGKPFRIRGSSP